MFLQKILDFQKMLVQETLIQKVYKKVLKNTDTTIVNKKDGHPVRAGDKSIRFELRNGDCGEDPGKWNDCESLRQRHELKWKRFKGKSWYAYSIYLPKDFKMFFLLNLQWLNSIKKEVGQL